MKAASAFIFYFILLAFPVLAQQPKLMMPFGHSGPINNILQSTNKKIIVSTSVDNTLKVWETNSQRLLYSFIGNYQKLFLTNDGRYLIADSLGGSSKIWDLLSGESLNIHMPGQKSHFSLNSDGKYLAILCKDSINFYDLKARKMLHTLHGNFNIYCNPVFSADGSKLIYSSIGRNYTTDIQVLNTKNYEIVKNIETNYSIFGINFLFGNRCLISNYSTLRIIDLDSSKLFFSIEDMGAFNCFDISNDGKMLAISSSGIIRVYNTIDGTLLKEQKFTGTINNINFNSKNSSLLISNFEMAEIWQWKKNVIESKLNFRSDLYSIYTCKYSSDKRNLFLGTDKVFYVADTSFSANSLTPFFGKVKSTEFITFDSSSTKIYAQMFGLFEKSDGKILSLTSGKVVGRLKDAYWVVDPFTPDGKYYFQYVKSYSREPASLYDANTGVFVKSLDSYSNSYGIFSPDKKLYFLPEKNGIKSYIRDGIKFTNKSELNPSPVYPLNPKFSANGKLLSIPELDDKTRVYDTHSGILRYSLSEQKDTIIQALFVSNDSLIITNTRGGNVGVWNAFNGKKIQTLNKVLEKGKLIESGIITPSKKLLISKIGSISAFDLITGKLSYEINNKIIRSSKVFPDRNQILINFFNDDTLHIFSTIDGSIFKEIPGNFSTVTIMQIVTNKSLLIAGHENGEMDFWNLNTGERINHSYSHHGAISQIVINNDQSLAISVSNDFSSKIWDLGSLNLKFTLASIDSSFIIINPEGYYMGDKESNKKLYFVNKLQTIGFEQLDVRYNRPDKILETIGSTDTALKNSYRHAYYKRIKKLGIDTTLFRENYNAPEADFENRDSIEYVQRKKVLPLHIYGLDSAYKLDRFNVWVNETPLFGIKGISLKNKNTQKLDTSISVNLSDSINIIETSITNVNGTESYRMPLQVNYIPNKKAKEILHFIGIGIDKFKDDTHNLQWSVKDVRDLTGNLKRKYGNNIIIDTLFNDNVTTANVTALKMRLQQITENDKVIIAYSGHGLLSKDYDYYLSTYDVNFKKPEEGGLPYDALENLLDSIPARNKLMLIDACHSGEVDKEEMLKYKAVKDSLRGIKGVILVNNDSSKIGMKNSFELMQELFVNVGRSTGATIISAAGGTQFAQESGELKNGVFTYSILEFMRDHSSATVTELKNYVNKRVPELTKGLQQPTSRTENKVVDWKVW